jgi:diadenosine tetraphosphate (Ap4A) HIT family hydrolase
MDNCPFCDVDGLRASEVTFENEFCIYASTRDPWDDSAVLPGSGNIVPFAHRSTPFDLTEDEWAATQDLLLRAKATQDERLAPDGYTLIWNCYPAGGQEVEHVHLHVLPRFDDEPFAGHGGRWHLKQPKNVRPDAWAKGNGAAQR